MKVLKPKMIRSKNRDLSLLFNEDAMPPGKRHRNDALLSYGVEMWNTPAMYSHDGYHVNWWCSLISPLIVCALTRGRRQCLEK